MSEPEDALETLIQWTKLPSAEREVTLIPGRRFRFDFVWKVQKVVVEVEGGSWISGRHTRGSGFESDAEKYALATLLGYRVFRFTPAMIADGRAIAWLEQALKGVA